MSRRYYRRRRSRSSDTDGLLLIIVLVIITAWSRPAWMIYVLYGGILILSVLLATYCYKLYQKQKVRARLATLAEIDTMDGLAFERFIAGLLTRRGFTKVSLTEKYDYGVDIIAQKNGKRWGIQVKRYSGLVKAAAVRQVVAALHEYKCDRAMVITNSTYSSVAVRLAKSNNCVLIDRMELAKLIEEVNDG